MPTAPDSEPSPYADGISGSDPGPGGSRHPRGEASSNLRGTTGPRDSGMGTCRGSEGPVNPWGTMRTWPCWAPIPGFAA